jgi:pyruvate/2-oxoglutarate dehydrogenase complex dihydrolipoamide acyltransferase (E2) component
MAFCPHCGKSVGEQATRCAECGGELEARGKPARFKGTMMMSPGTAPLIQPPKAGQPRATNPAAQPAAVAGAPKPSPGAIAATMPMPAAGPIAEAAAAAAAAKKPAALKATMLGTGEGGLANIGKGLAAAQPQSNPAPAAPAPEPAPAPRANPAPAPQPAAVTRREAPPQEDDSKRFLVGDPMAPTGAPATKGQPLRGMSRLSQEIPRDRSATWIVVGIIGVCVIAALGYVAARLLGIAN